MKSINVVLGAQWGDEGKGKIVDFLSAKSDVILRFNGGNNAGHTIVFQGKKYILHTLPSGILRRGVVNITGPLVVHDLEVVAQEIELASENGAKVVLDKNAPLILPLHKQVDSARERLAGAKKIGTTKRGIGPAYEDFWSRRGLSLHDLQSKKSIAFALERRGYFQEKENLLKSLGEKSLSFQETVDYLSRYTFLYEYAQDTRELVSEYVQQGKVLLFEGAQGVLLDRVHGIVNPYVTSSFCGVGGAWTSFGFYPPSQEVRVIGIAKAYLTRVGNGPFPTELKGRIGDTIRQKGGEYGSTTGRPRRCGWLDLELLRYAVRRGGITELAITKLDVLAGLSKVVLQDKHEKIILPGWEGDLSSARRLEDLPASARSYLSEISQRVGVKISFVGVGPDRENLIVL